MTTARVTAGSGAIPVFGAGTVRPSAEIDIAPQVAFLQAEEEAAIARAEFDVYSNRQADSGLPAEAGPLALREPQLTAARAALAREEARVADANLALARTRVNAPFDGFVRDEAVDVGQYVTPGQQVGRLFAADAVEVVVPMSDGNAALIPGLWALRAGDDERGVAARVVAEYGDTRYAWDGYVDRAEASLDEQTRTIDVIVRAPDPFTAGVPVGAAAARRR